eukprot:TRINITY_DN8161_c0_g1_i1.p1 TRINITY_DN8161_c0_g1~~TRINITY_DN8161_c0_g1_i1.p1  ORF type:complete len:376 (+),score=92.34 TRINITY_DN8161_c0_g1_i1:284-1411(+)
MKSAYFTSDDPFKFGLMQGNRFKNEIQKTVKFSFQLQDLINFNQTNDGKYIYESFYNTHDELYPNYIQELKGMAKGSNVDFSELFLLNLMPEYQLGGFMKNNNNNTIISHCTDLFFKNETSYIFGHNEDGNKLVREFGYLIEAKLSYQSGNLNDNNNDDYYSFSSFTYPAQLIANAYSWKSNGLVLTMNSVFPTDIHIGGIGQYFIVRDVLNSNSINDALKRCNVSNSASGLSLNIGMVNERRIINVEIAPGDHNLDYKEMLINNTNKDNQNNTSVYNDHFNNYRRIKTPFIVDKSSEHREKTVLMNPPHSASDVISLLGNSTSDYPIYRNGASPDNASTISTAIFDFILNRVDVYTSNPTFNDPLFSQSIISSL